MRNLGHSILGVLPVVLHQPESPHVIPFNLALECIKALADFIMMAQYQCHMSETITYMEDYLDRFHQMKDIFLEFQVTKRTQTKIDNQRRELRHHWAQTSKPITPSKRGWNLDADPAEENQRCMDMLYSESHFNLFKIHLPTDLSAHRGQFGNNPLYLTE